MPVSPIPDGYHTITPYIVVKGAKAALDFYEEAFGAELKIKLDHHDGRIAHAEIQIGDSRVMLADEFPEMDAVAPAAGDATSFSLMIYVNDVDEVFERALEAGASVKRPVVDQFYGDRSGVLVDPFGHVWSIATHIKDLQQAEVQKIWNEMQQ
ncbi:MAG: VOC family protein [Planctomycetaceae bacterium]|nr:VOC family protein [Planctomycetaceae bacterium]